MGEARVKKKIVAALAVPLLLGASECSSGNQPKPMAGIVVQRTFDGDEKTGLRYLLQVRKNDGNLIWIREPFANWYACSKGEFYPNCKYNSKAV